MRPISTTDQNGYISDDLLANTHVSTGTENIQDNNIIDFINLYNQDSSNQIKYFTGFVSKDYVSKENVLPYVSHGDINFGSYMPFDFIIANFTNSETNKLQLLNYKFPNTEGNILQQIHQSQLGQMINLQNINLLAQDYKNEDIKFSDIVMETINQFDYFSQQLNNSPYLLVIQSSMASDAIKQNDTTKLITELSEIDQIISQIKDKNQTILLMSTAEVGGFNIPDKYEDLNNMGLQQPNQSQWQSNIEQYMSDVKQIVQNMQFSINSNQNSMEQVVLAAQNLDYAKMRTINNVKDVNGLIKSLITDKQYNSDKYNVKLNDRWWISSFPQNESSNIAAIVIICIVIVICLLAIAFVIYQMVRNKCGKQQFNGELLV